MAQNQDKTYTTTLTSSLQINQEHSVTHV